MYSQQENNIIRIDNNKNQDKRAPCGIQFCDIVLYCTLVYEHRENERTAILFPDAVVEDLSTIWLRSYYETKYLFLIEKGKWKKHVRGILEQFMNPRFTCHACLPMQVYAQLTEVQETWIQVPENRIRRQTKLRL